MRIQIMWIAVVVMLCSGTFSPLFGMQPGRGRLAGQRPSQAGSARQQGQRVRWQDEADDDDGGPRGVKRARVSEKEEEEENRALKEPYYVFVNVPISRLRHYDSGQIIRVLENMLREDAVRAQTEEDFLNDEEVEKTKARIRELRQPARQAAAPTSSGRPAVRTVTAAAAQEDPQELLKELKRLLATSADLQINYQDAKDKREQRLAELQTAQKAKRADLERLQKEEKEARAFVAEANSIGTLRNEIAVGFAGITKDVHRELPAKKGWFGW